MMLSWKWFGRFLVLAVCVSGAATSSLWAQNCDSGSPKKGFIPSCLARPVHGTHAANRSPLAPYGHDEMASMRQFHQRRQQALATLSPVERQRIALMWDREEALVNLTVHQRQYLLRQWGADGSLSPAEYRYMQNVWGDGAGNGMGAGAAGAMGMGMPGYMPGMGPGGMFAWFDGLGHQQPADAPSGLPHFGLRPLVDMEPSEPRHPFVQKLLGAPKTGEPVMPLPTYTTRGPRDFLLANPPSIGY